MHAPSDYCLRSGWRLKSQVVAGRLALVYTLLHLGAIVYGWQRGAFSQSTSGEAVAVAVGLCVPVLIGLLFASWRSSIGLSESSVVLWSSFLRLPLTRDVVPAASIRALRMDRQGSRSVVRIILWSGSELLFFSVDESVQNDLIVISDWATRNGVTYHDCHAMRHA